MCVHWVNEVVVFLLKLYFFFSPVNLFVVFVFYPKGQIFRGCQSRPPFGPPPSSQKKWEFGAPPCNEKVIYLLFIRKVFLYYFSLVAHLHKARNSG